MTLRSFQLGSEHFFSAQMFELVGQNKNVTIRTANGRSFASIIMIYRDRTAGVGLFHSTFQVLKSLSRNGSAKRFFEFKLLQS